MSIQDFGTIEANASLKQVINALADLQDTLNFLLNGNLDVRNIRASSITADRLKVTELSAISANLGKVIAGILIGAYISTADGTYPRIDFSSANNLLTAFSTATKYVSITPTQGGTPGLAWTDGSTVAYAIAESSIGFFLKAFLGALTLQASNNIDLDPAGALQINGTSGYSGSFSAITSVDFTTQTTTSTTVNVTKGIITSVV